MEVLTTRPYLALRLNEEYSYTSVSLWVFMTCSRLNFTFTFLLLAINAQELHHPLK
jgi:hypothetical protein